MNDPKTSPCPSCDAEPGAPCYTPVDGVDTQWDHDTRILAALFPREIQDVGPDAARWQPAMSGDGRG